MVKGQAKKTQPPLRLDNLPDLLTPREVAQLLRVSVITLKRWGKSGRLPAIRINRRGDRRYRKDVILRFLGLEEEKQKEV